jgi:hypothetical protein
MFPQAANLILNSPNFAPSRRDIEQAFFAALRSLNTDYLRSLSELEGFDPNIGSDSNGLPAVFRAVSLGISANVIGLRGLHLYVKGIRGESLIAAAVKKPALLAAILERMREGINNVDVFGNSALMTAIETRSFGAIPLLIESGIDLRAKNFAGETAWDIAVSTLRMDNLPEPEDQDLYLDTIADWVSGLPSSSTIKS